jgi:hypothetical protein
MPLYGTSVTSTLVIFFSCDTETCELEEPYPAESFPEFFLMCAMNSGSVFAGKSAFTISTRHVVARRATGAKSFAGSYGSFL